jgi:hypothetical protein
MSLIANKREKEGININKRINVGTIVQITSNKVLWVTLDGIGLFFLLNK